MFYQAVKFLKQAPVKCEMYNDFTWCWMCKYRLIVTDSDHIFLKMSGPSCECNAHLTHLFLVVIMTRAVKTAHDRKDDSKKMSTYILRLKCVILKVKLLHGGFCHALAKQLHIYKEDGAN